MKVTKEGEYPNVGDEAEDSDYEIESEQPDGSAPGEQGDEEETEPGSLPVLTIGSVARYVRHTTIVMLEPLTRLTAGDLCSFICTQA